MTSSNTSSMVNGFFRKSLSFSFTCRVYVTSA
jgi:hypothetical protein